MELPVVNEIGTVVCLGCALKPDGDCDPHCSSSAQSSPGIVVSIKLDASGRETILGSQGVFFQIHDGVAEHLGNVEPEEVAFGVNVRIADLKAPATFREMFGLSTINLRQDNVCCPREPHVVQFAQALVHECSGRLLIRQKTILFVLFQSGADFFVARIFVTPMTLKRIVDVFPIDDEEVWGKESPIRDGPGYYILTVSPHAVPDSA